MGPALVLALVLALELVMDLDLSLGVQKAENRCMVEKACEPDVRSGHQVVEVEGGH